MSLQILPFNKTLLKKDWKMTKWLCYVVLGILFFTMTLGVINTYNNYQQTLKQVAEYPDHYQNFDAQGFKYYIKSEVEHRFKALSGGELGIIVFIPMIVAALLFGEEKRRKTFEALSTMPFTRWEIFFNKAIAAFVNVISPFLINALIMIIALGLSKGLRDFYSVGAVMSWLGANTFRLFVILSFSLLFASLTGTSISQLVLTVIFFIFPIGFAGLIEMNMSAWGYNVSVIGKFLDTFGMYTTPGVLDGIENVPIAYHLISAVVMLIASKLLFDRNKLERSGETLEFESIETFFKVGVAGCFSLLIGVMFTWLAHGWSLFATDNRMYIILGYIVGIFAGWFIASYSIKSNRVKV